MFWKEGSGHSSLATAEWLEEDHWKQVASFGGDAPDDVISFEKYGKWKGLNNDGLIVG